MAGSCMTENDVFRSHLVALHAGSEWHDQLSGKVRTQLCTAKQLCEHAQVSGN